MLPLPGKEEARRVNNNAYAAVRYCNEYITSNSWPPEQVMLDFIHNREGRYTHKTRSIKTYGSKYYNHTLAKKLYDSGAIMDCRLRQTAFRRVGWRIRMYGESISDKGDPTEILECMRAYSNILQHVICSGEILPLPGKYEGNIHPILDMIQFIELSWDGIGQGILLTPLIGLV